MTQRKLPNLMADIKAIMLQAQASEWGAIVSCSSSEAFQRKFHKERNDCRKTGDLSFDILRCRIINPTTVYLIKDNTDAGLGEGNSQTEPGGQE